MARPTAQALNRNPGVTSDRTTAAPGLAVQAPLNVAVAPNNMQALAEILGVGADIAVSRAAAESKARVQEENELMEAKAEAQFHADELDEEQYRKSRTYRRKVQTLTGAREGVEASIALSNDVAQFIRDNPYADENELRDYIVARKDILLKDEDGNVKGFMGDPIAASIVQASLNDTSYQIIAKHRAGYESRMREKGGDEAVGLFMANTVKNGTATVGDVQNAAVMLRSLGFTPEEVNTKLAQAAMTVARETLNPDILKALPPVWQDGTLGPAADPVLRDNINSQLSLIGKQRDAKKLEEQAPLRLAYYNRMEDKTRNGLPITDEDQKEGLALGIGESTLAGFRDQSERRRIALEEEAARKAEKETEHLRDLEDIRANPWAQSNDKIEKTFGKLHDDAVAAGNPAAAWTAIQEAIRYNALPESVRNRLNRIPANPQQFAQWRKDMELIDNADDQVFASLKPDSRNAYMAANALIASGRFSDTQVYERIQSRDPQRGSTYAQSKEGQSAIKSIGAAGGTVGMAKAQQLVEVFASFPDIGDTEAANMASEAFRKNYYVENGKVFDKNIIAGPQMTNWARIRFAQDRTNAGQFTEADDVVIAQIDGSTDIMFTIRGEPSTAVRVPAADLHRQMQGDAARARAAREAPARAAEQAATTNLNPWRYVAGENGLQRQQRAGRENEARRAAGLPVFPTPTSWDNANRR